MASSLWILVLSISVVAAQKFSCRDVLTAPEKQTHLDVRMDTGGNTSQPGEAIHIRVSEGLGDIGLRVIVAAVKTGTNQTVGSFIISAEQPGVSGLECNVANGHQPDSIVVQSDQTSAVLTWLAPQPDDGKAAGDLGEQGIQFRATFLDADDMKHSLTSIMMLPVLEPLRPLEPERDQSAIDAEMHQTLSEDQIKMEMERKAAEQIDLENQASEDDWSKAELLAQRQLAEQIHQEEMEYERTLRREEEERLARIRAEIRDKEEYDRKMAAEDDLYEDINQLEKEIDILAPAENEIDFQASGSSTVAVGIAYMVMFIGRLVM